MLSRKRCHTIIIDNDKFMIDEVENTLALFDFMARIGDEPEIYNGSEVAIFVFESKMSRKRVIKRLKKLLGQMYDINEGRFLIQVTKKGRKMES